MTDTKPLDLDAILQMVEDARTDPDMLGYLVFEDIPALVARVRDAEGESQDLRYILGKRTKDLTDLDARVRELDRQNEVLLTQYQDVVAVDMQRTARIWELEARVRELEAIADGLHAHINDLIAGKWEPDK